MWPRAAVHDALHTTGAMESADIALNACSTQRLLCSLAWLTPAGWHAMARTYQAVVYIVTKPWDPPILSLAT